MNSKIGIYTSIYTFMYTLDLYDMHIVYTLNDMQKSKTKSKVVTKSWRPTATYIFEEACGVQNDFENQVGHKVQSLPNQLSHNK